MSTQSPTAQLHQRITELEVRLNKVTEGATSCRCATRTARRAFLAEARVTLPAPGIPMPKNYAFHGYVQAIVPADKAGNEPQLQVVEAALHDAAEEKYKNVVDVELANWSEVPAGWLRDAQTEEE